MAEGPQCLLRAQWLDARLRGRAPRWWVARRPELEGLGDALQGRSVTAVRARGKRILFDLDDGRVLLHSLLMDGRWRSLGPGAALPPDAWLALGLEEETLVNRGGQRFVLRSREDVERELDALGPDVLARPYPRRELLRALGNTDAPLDALLLEPRALTGIGNTAKSEALFEARLDPTLAADELTPAARAALVRALHQVTRESLLRSGRWRQRVYQREGRPCPRCSTPIERLARGRPPRDTFLCPRCQAPGRGRPGTFDEHEPPQGRLRIGLAVWGHQDFAGTLFPPGTPRTRWLEQYARSFLAVEGNALFYALPASEVLQGWCTRVPADFRFCPKLARDVTHATSLREGLAHLPRYVERIRAFGPHLGPVFAQLSEHRGPDEFDGLEALLGAWPRDLPPLLIEVRHPGWFEDGPRDRLERLLESNGAGRALLDTRAMFAGPGDPQAGSQRRKPAVPHRPEAVGRDVLVRYVGHPELERNASALETWAERIDLWLHEGRSVTFFAHCPDESRSPSIARALSESLAALQNPQRGLGDTEIHRPATQLRLF